MNKAARLRIRRHRKKNPLDDENPAIDVPILIPERRPFPSRSIPRVIEQNVETVVDWMNWLENVDDVDVRRRSNPAVERLKAKIAELQGQRLIVEEGQSALRGFTRQEEFSVKRRIFSQKYGRIPRSLFENGCFVACRCHGKFQKTLRKKL